MPANRSITLTDEANMDGEVVVTAHLENVETGVHFTDDDLSFRITIENNSDYTLNNPYLTSIVAVGNGKAEPLSKTDHNLEDIEPRSQREVSESIDAMVLEGHAIVGIGTPSLPGITPDDNTVKFNANYSMKDSYEPLASFSVWDRDHYEVVHEQPQRTQRLATLLSILVVALATLQLFSALEKPIVGGIAALVVVVGIVKLSNTYGVPELIKSDQL